MCTMLLESNCVVQPAALPSKDKAAPVNKWNESAATATVQLADGFLIGFG